MLTIDALRAALKRVSYWPNYRMIIFQHPHEGIWMSIKAELPDADHPTRTTIVNIKTAVPPIPDENYFFAWLNWRLGQVSSHEHREAFRVDNRKYDDPHAPDAN